MARRDDPKPYTPKGKRAGSKESPLTQTDMVNNPPHYNQGDIECIDAIKAQLTPDEYVGHLRGCIAKYNWRLLNKGDPVENTGKLIWYANKLHEALSDRS